MIRAGVLVLAFALTATPAFAAHWTVDRAKSRLGFRVDWDGAPFDATFKSWNADIDFDPDDLATSHVTVKIDMASVTSAVPEHDSDMKTEMGFDPAKFPVATFAVTKFLKMGPLYLAEGTLSLRGVTKPIGLPFALSISGKTAHMTGSAQIARAAFGVGTTEGAEDVNVSADAFVSVDLTATAAPR